MPLEDEIHVDVDIDINTSRLQYTFLASMYIAAVIALALCVLDFNVKMALLGLIVLSGFFDVRKHVLSPSRLTIKHTKAFGWQIAEAEGVQFVKILPSTVLTPVIIILHIKNENNASYFFAIFHDSMPPQDFRRLTVSLKLYGLERSG